MMNWIPIDKDWPGRGELPNDHVSVLISIEDAVIEAYRMGDHWVLDGAGTFDIEEVDAWMPLPKPYRG